MASSVLVSAPPRDTPFFDRQTGRITQPWLEWFGSITATATIVQNLQTLQVIAEDNSTDGNSAEILTQVSDLVALLAEPRRPAFGDAADELRAMIAAGLEANNAWRSEVDELRALIVAGEPLPGALIADLAPVTSVFGRLGDIAAQASDYSSFYDASGAAASAQTAAETYSSNGSNISSGTVAAARLPSNVAYLNAIQTWGQTNTYTAQIRAAAFAMGFRVVTASTDTASAATDHTLALNGVTTETLPASPANGTEFYLLNVSTTAAVTISGNGHNISGNGASASTYSLPAGAGIALVYDSTNTLWRLVLTSPGFVPLNPANNLSDLASASTARTNLGLGTAATQAIGSWTSYTPSLTPGGSMTISGVTIYDAQYQVCGPTLNFKIQVSCTLGGTASNNLTISLPQAIAGNNSLLCSAVNLNYAGWAAAWAYANSGGITLYASGLGNFPSGNFQFMISGSYRIA